MSLILPDRDWPGRLRFVLWATMIATSFALRAAESPPAADAAKDNGDDNSNPYSVIVDRNIFHLNPPPPPPEPEKPKVEVPLVKISGVVNVGNTRKVLFVSQPKDKKDGPIYYSLAEGEKSSDGKLELVKISPAQDKVDIVNAGVVTNLTLRDDSLAPSTTAPTPAVAAKDAPPPPAPEPGIPGRRIFPNRLPPGVPPGGENAFSNPAHRHNIPQ